MFLQMSSTPSVVFTAAKTVGPSPLQVCTIAMQFVMHRNKECKNSCVRVCVFLIIFDLLLIPHSRRVTSHDVEVCADRFGEIDLYADLHVLVHICGCTCDCFNCQLRIWKIFAFITPLSPHRQLQPLTLLCSLTFVAATSQTPSPCSRRAGPTG